MTIKRFYPLVLVLSVFILIISMITDGIVKNNSGVFTYVLDDPYIHAAMSKNIALHGVYGVTKHGVTGSSSSPLWPLIGAVIDLVAGPSAYLTWPFWTNVVLAIILIFVLFFIFKKSGFTSCQNLAALLSIMLLTPFFSLVLTGMEHMLQVLAVLLFVYFSALSLENENNKLNFIALLAAVFTGTAVRYEMVFPAFVVAVLFVLKKNPVKALLVMAFAFLPVLFFGFFLVSNDWMFIPTSIMLKGGIPDFRSWTWPARLLGYNAIEQFTRYPHLLTLSMLVAVLYAFFSWKKDKSFFSVESTLSVVTLFTTIAHLQFAGVGQFYRYEAYLVALNIFTIAFLLRKAFANGSLSMPEKIVSPVFFAAAIFVLLAMLPVVQRAAESFKRAPAAARNIYSQQYQMGKFLNLYYTDKCVAAVDIGAISVMSDIKLLDLWGLANIEVAVAIKTHKNNKQFMEAITKKASPQVIMLGTDDSYFKDRIPDSFIPVAAWIIPDNVVCSSATLTFYGLNKNDAELLKSNLKNFESELPFDVEKKYY